MVKTESTMLPLGTPAPSFALLEPLTGKTVSLEEIKGEKGTLVVFMCNHCPFVVHIQSQLKSLGTDLKNMSISMVGISSNDVTSYPEDGVQPMAEMARSTFSSFPYLYDETQQVAKAFQAACTPDLYLFDSDLNLYYRGRIDDATPGNRQPVTGAALRDAAEKLVAGLPFPEGTMKPSVGCSIKWKSGNGPNY